MPQPTNRMPRDDERQVTICQQNINKSLIAQIDLLHQLDPSTHNICAIQEPYLDHNHNSRATHNWYTIYPKEHYVEPSKTRSLMLVNKRIATDAWMQIDCRSSDVTAVQVSTGLGSMVIVNTYSDNVCQEGMRRAVHAIKTSL